MLDKLCEVPIGRQPLQSGITDIDENQPRIAGALPEFFVDRAPNGIGAVAPAPVHVEGKLFQAFEAGGHAGQQVACR